MGNAKSKASNSEESVLKKQNKCIICFDEDTRPGIRCDFNHFLCQQCITPYINSCVEDVGKLKDQGYNIRCPAVEAGVRCKSSPWSCSNLCKMIGESDSLDRYVDALVSVCRQGVEKEYKTTILKEEVIPLLLDALNLRCPNAACKVVLDPSPDGCCAIRCGSCAIHACFLCFQICADSSSCHKHVRECPCSPKSDNLFIAEKERIPAQRRMRVMTLRRVLAEIVLDVPSRGAEQLCDTTSIEATSASNKAGEKLGKCARAKKLLSKIQKELSDLQITADDVFHLDVTVATRPRARSSFPGPVLQAARPQVFGQGADQQGRHRRAVAAVLIGLVLFFVVLVFVINMLASISNRHKMEHGEPQCSGVPLNAEGSVYNATQQGGAVSDYLVSAQRVLDIATGLECAECTAAEQDSWGLFTLQSLCWLIGFLLLAVLAGQGLQLVL